MLALVQKEYVWEVMDVFGGLADKQVHNMEDQVTRTRILQGGSIALYYISLISGLEI